MDDRFISKTSLIATSIRKVIYFNRKKLNTDTFKVIKTIKHEQKIQFYKNLLF